MQLTEKIDFLMKEKGINKSELSRQSGIPYMTIINFYEKGTDNVKLSTLKKLSKYFNVSLDYLANDEVTVAETEKAPEPEEPVSEAEIEQLAIQLYNALLSAGLVEEGQELTEHQMRAIEGICDILAVVFDSEN